MTSYQSARRLLLEDWGHMFLCNVLMNECFVLNSYKPYLIAASDWSPVK